jgi:hypothetical protein
MLSGAKQPPTASDSVSQLRFKGAGGVQSGMRRLTAGNLGMDARAATGTRRRSEHADDDLHPVR